MSFFENLFNKKKPKDIAKDRLMMVLAYERASTHIENLEDLKKDLIRVVQKYVKIKDVIIKTDSHKDFEALEIEIILNK